MVSSNRDPALSFCILLIWKLINPWWWLSLPRFSSHPHHQPPASGHWHQSQEHYNGLLTGPLASSCLPQLLCNLDQPSDHLNILHYPCHSPTVELSMSPHCLQSEYLMLKTPVFSGVAHTPLPLLQLPCLGLYNSNSKHCLFDTYVLIGTFLLIKLSIYLSIHTISLTTYIF